MSSSGQTVTEFLVSTSLVILTVVGSGWLLHAEWRRSQCAYLVFQTAHARLVGRVSLASPSVRVTENGTEVDADGKCGQAHESVRLKKLEAIQW